MKLETLLRKLKEIDDYGMQEFWDKDFFGSCPCFRGEKTIEGKKIGFWGRCWRVSEHSQDLHYWGEWDKKTLRNVAKEVKRALDAQEWYNPYTLIFDSSLTKPTTQSIKGLEHGENELKTE